MLLYMSTNLLNGINLDITLSTQDVTVNIGYSVKRKPQDFTNELDMEKVREE